MHLLARRVSVVNKMLESFLSLASDDLSAIRNSQDYYPLPGLVTFRRLSYSRYRHVAPGFCLFVVWSGPRQFFERLYLPLVLAAAQSPSCPAREILA